MLTRNFCWNGGILSSVRRSKIQALDAVAAQEIQMLQGSMSVGNGRERYLFIDHLAGMQPILINHDFLVLGKDQIKFVPTCFSILMSSLTCTNIGREKMALGLRDEVLPLEAC